MEGEQLEPETLLAIKILKFLEKQTNLNPNLAVKALETALVSLAMTLKIPKETLREQIESYIQDCYLLSLAEGT
jgi:hypothetical protein